MATTVIFLLWLMALWRSSICHSLDADGVLRSKNTVGMENEKAAEHLFRHRHSFYHDLEPVLAVKSRHDRGHLQIENLDSLFATEDHIKYIPAKLKLLSHAVQQSTIPDTARTPMQSQQELLVESFNVLPNTSDKETVVNLAKMTSDAYLLDPWGPGWLNTSLGFNFTDRFGWKDDGLRGHVFTNKDDSIVSAYGSHDLELSSFDTLTLYQHLEL